MRIVKPRSQRFVWTLAAGVLLLCGGSSGSAATQTDFEILTSGTRPVSAKDFTALVLTTDSEARSRIRALEVQCYGSVSRKPTRMAFPPPNSVRLATKVTRFPTNASVPSVLVFTWRMPPKTAGKSFYASCNGSVETVERTYQFDGSPSRWVIRRS
jgi:hypothetical protein